MSYVTLEAEVDRGQLVAKEPSGMFPSSLEFLAARVAAYSRDRLDLGNAGLSESFYYNSLSFCAVDAVFSIGVRYGGVKAVVNRVAERFQVTPFRAGGPYPEPAAQIQTSQLLDVMNRLRDPANELFCNRCKINPRAKTPTSKAEVVGRFLQTLKSRGVETFQDLRRAINWNQDNFQALSCSEDLLLNELKDLPGLRSGIVVDYFLMLAGDDQGVKADRWVIGFINAATGETVDPPTAKQVIIAACGILNREFADLRPRTLDHQIWKFQRAQGSATGVAKAAVEHARRICRGVVPGADRCRNIMPTVKAGNVVAFEAVAA